MRQRASLILGVAMRYLLRITGLTVALVALPVLGATMRRGGGVLGFALAIVALLFIWLWLPRLAHNAFEVGTYAVAARRYRWLEWLATSRTRERAARLSRAGCAVAAGDGAMAERLLAALDTSVLGGAERAVWLNNRACAQLAAGHDAATALALADEASALRPDVPALQHTRAMALVALGRVDDAIAILEGMRTAGELPRRLEADRCRELARAWERKGEAAYAEDYRLRAEAYSR